MRSTVGAGQFPHPPSEVRDGVYVSSVGASGDRSGTLLSVNNIDWGDVPTWITAAATVAALVAAVLAVRASWQVLKLEAQRENRAEQAEAERRSREDRADQADLVAVWPAGYSGAVIRNGSALPIYRVTVTYVTSAGEVHESTEVDVVPPGEREAPWPPDAQTPDDEGNVTFNFDLVHARNGIRFVDSAGRRWHRDGNGVLALTGRDEPLVLDETQLNSGTLQ